MSKDTSHRPIPKELLQNTILDASLTVLDDDSFYHSRTYPSLSHRGETYLNTRGQLATPIVALGPCGTIFDRNVRVTLPLTKGILNNVIR